MESGLNFALHWAVLNYLQNHLVPCNAFAPILSSGEATIIVDALYLWQRVRMPAMAGTVRAPDAGISAAV